MDAVGWVGVNILKSIFFRRNGGLVKPKNVWFIREWQ